ncbi:MAG TPA: CarD family transcriptional regulator, partial [bacterium]|nr:CarD family transcriptional regulator [bacterium]
MKHLFSSLEKARSFQSLLRLSENPAPGWCLGASPPALAFLLAGLFQTLHQHLLVILPEERTAERFYQDAATFLDQEKLLFFPPLENHGKAPQPFSEETAERMRVLLAWASSESNFFTVSCLSAILPLVPSVNKIKEARLCLAPASAVSRQGLVEKLLRYGYEEKELVEFPGEFARRGGIIDLFPPESSFPVRLELSGDQVVSLRRFQVASQISFEKIHQIVLYPLSEQYLSGDDRVPITSFLERALVFLVEAHSPAIRELPATGDDLSCVASSLLQELKKRAIICRRDFSAEARASFVHFITAETRERFRLTEPFLWDRYPGERLIIFSNNVSQEKRLQQILAEKKISVELTEFARGSLSRGFSLPEINLTFLSNDELFARYQSRHVRLRQIESLPVSTWEELKVGDYVVHYNEGIGRFLGLQEITAGQQKSEYIVIEYAGGDKLYVPISQIGFIHRYVGSRQPELSRLGSRGWAQTKKKVESAIRDLAAELYSLYLERRREKGIVFPPDDEWQQAFEDSFLFEETADQRQTIAEVKKDMMSARIMDRLVCGDSGYGKTEVAMRAAFKAVMSGRQVAVLVPTTVLALQHYLTFKERLADFPVQVAMLSRLVPEAEQQTILKKLRAGQIDILIGTHRLLSPDIQFRSLGLLVVDEEQRFGVTHKERIKSLFRRIDVLTLSATPIPRTLYLSLSGVRDISLIETPPLGRLAVSTYVGRRNDRLIAQAIRHELERGGQVFYLHNFVFDIESVAEKVRKLVPEASVAVAHGQMPGKTLEAVMERFASGEVDVLVATTIVENGVDIPRANTLIVDQAHRFGLADLYQLRGRVGRYKWRAYAFFLIPPGLPVTDQAKQRLAALRELNRPGSGFHVAMKDLQIR